MGRVTLLDGRNTGWIAFAVGLFLSTIVHVWAVSSLFQSRSGELGSVDTQTTAISVNLETTDVIDAIENAAAREAASSPLGTPVEAAKERKNEPDEVKDKEAMLPVQTKEDAERQRLSDEALMKEKPKEEAEREQTKRAPEDLTPAQKLTEIEDAQEKKEKNQQAPSAGGSGTTGAAEALESQGMVSASQGTILNYGASLRALISSNAPRNIRKTSIRLAFSIAPTGKLIAVDVLEPSSNPEVDKRMVDLVRSLSSRFPPPPPGASTRQLSYNIEIIFR